MAKALDISLPAPEEGTCDLLVIAGEHSGDEHAAKLVAQLCAIDPTKKVCAIGGAALRNESPAQFLFDLTEHSVVGLVEVLKNYSFFKALFEKVLSWIAEYKPKAVCFVDYPGFNLALAKELKKRKISVKGGGQVRLLYYISPQIWAWKAKRRFAMADCLDSLGVIFPFEPKCYADTSLNVQYVGHPFVSGESRFNISYNANADILLLPGSRKSAIAKIYPVMLKAARLMGKDAKFTTLYPDEKIKAQLDKILQKFGDVNITLKKADNAPLKASAVLMSSGTMSLLVCLAGIPGAIVYVANPLTYIIGRMLVNVKYLSLANIVLDKPAWPEFLQGQASPKKLAAYMAKCLKDPNCKNEAFENARQLRRLLFAENNTCAAEWVLSFL